MLGNKLFKLYFLLILVTSFTYRTNAQSGLSSPYSAAGLGYLNNVNNLQNKSMGEIGIGTRFSSTINLFNPASLTAIDTTSFVFEGAVFANYTTLKTDYTSETASTAGLDQLLFGFPITKWWKSSIGLIPYSAVGYHVNDLSYIENIGTINHEFVGEGGLSKFYWAHAFEPIKSISIGVNVSYLFGTINKVQNVTFPDTAYMLSTKVENMVSIGDLYVELGIQYYKEIKPNLLLVVGGIYNPKASMNADGTHLARTYLGEINDVEVFRDTVDYIASKGQVVIPEAYGFGFSLNKRDHWLFGIDYKFEKWEDYSSFERSDSLVNSHIIAAGGEYTPNYASNSYVNRINYRLGARYSQTYLNIRDTQINDYGITFGIGLPLRSNAVRGSKSKVNIGFEAGRRGTMEKGLVQENYFNFYLGVTVNEFWFFKRRYE